MIVKESLKRKSLYFLSVYLFLFITIIGSTTFFVVQKPAEEKLRTNLDLRTTLLSNYIQNTLERSDTMLNNLASIATYTEHFETLNQLIPAMLQSSSDIFISGGIWPEPNSVKNEIERNSLFYTKTPQNTVEQVKSWNYESSPPYYQEPWYVSAKGQAPNQIYWSDVYVDPYTHIKMITASTPYYQNGDFLGVVTVDVSLNDLVKYTKEQASKYELGIILRDQTGAMIAEHQFKIVDGIYISSNQFGAYEWTVDVVNSNKLVFEEVLELVTDLELRLIPILLLCVVVGYYLFVTRLVSPLVAISKKVSETSDGDMINIGYKSQDEIGYLIDVFNKKTIYLKEEKRKAEASTKAKSAFLATLSHEIRTPMNGVLGTAQLLLKSDLDEQQLKYLNSLYDSGEHMMTLLNEILDFSKIEEGRLELDKTKFPIASIIGSINSVYYTMSSEKGLTFQVHSDIDDNCWYYADKARLRQILFNLLSNAIKFTEKGVVGVHLKETQQNGKTYLDMKVRDTGIGMSAEALSRIFNPFEQAESSTTRRFGGTGLGLSIVKRLVDLMGGEISVKSEVGIGTSFNVRIAVTTCGEDVQEITQTQKLDYRGLSVLIVEDNRINTMIIDSFMKNKGFITTCVENGEQAVQQLASRGFDLVLMDNHMPVMDGVAAITSMRKLPGMAKETLIFGCTADVFKETRERMTKAGADYIIAKPIDERELDDALLMYSERLFNGDIVYVDTPLDAPHHEQVSSSESLPV